MDQSEEFRLADRAQSSKVQSSSPIATPNDLAIVVYDPYFGPNLVCSDLEEEPVREVPMQTSRKRSRQISKPKKCKKLRSSKAAASKKSFPESSHGHQPSVPSPRRTRSATAKSVPPSVATKGTNAASSSTSRTSASTFSPESASNTQDQDADFCSSPIGYDCSKAYSLKFYSAINEEVWTTMSSRGIIAERNINVIKFKDTGILDLLKHSGLMGTVSLAEKFSPDLVYEFYSNLSADIAIANSPVYGKIYIRGNALDFSPALINKLCHCPNFLELEHMVDFTTPVCPDKIASELTGRSFNWTKANALRASVLTSKYSMLHKLGLYNWIPGSHKNNLSLELAKFLYFVGTGQVFNFGQVIFDHIVQFAGDRTTLHGLPFPSLICRVLVSHAPVLLAKDKMMPLAPPLMVSAKLFRGPRVVDVEGESSHAAEGPVSTCPGCTKNFVLLQSLQQTSVKMQTELEAMRICQDKAGNDIKQVIDMQVTFQADMRRQMIRLLSLLPMSSDSTEDPPE